VLSEALALLEQIDPKEQFRQRHRSHLIGKIDFMKGDYLGAIRKYEYSLKTYGCHIGLICDLTMSLMLIGDYASTATI
jgi:hypothetical protein